MIFILLQLLGSLAAVPLVLMYQFVVTGTVDADAAGAQTLVPGSLLTLFFTVWYLWNKKVDINHRNKSGKAITSYLTALRMYNGDNPARKRIADELQLCVEIVPAEGADGENGLKMLRFRHGLMGLGNIGGRGVGGGTKPPIRL